MTATARWRLLPLLPPLLLVGGGLRLWDYTAVETGTVVAFARTLAAGGGFALEPGAVQTFGVASPLWTVLLAGGAALGLDPLALAKGLGLALAALALALLPGLSARLNGRAHGRPHDLLAPLVLGLNPDLWRHAVGGLETGLALLLLCWALRRFVGEERRFCCGEAGAGGRAELGSALPLGLLLLVRPEALAWFGGLALARLLARVTAWRVGWGTPVWLLIVPLCAGLFALISYALFADPLPGPFSARQAFAFTQLGHPEAVARGALALQLSWQRWGLSLPLAFVAAVGALRPLNYWGRMGLLFAGVAVALGLVASGGDAEGRLALPLALIFALLLAEGLEACLRRLGGALPRATPGRRAVVLLLAAGLFALPLWRSVETLRRPPESPFQRQFALFDALQRLLGELGWEPHRARVLTTTPGVAAHAGFGVVDASGVTDPTIRRYSGNRKPLELHQVIFRSRRPDILVEQGHFKAAHNFTAHPETNRRYVSVHLPGFPGARVSLARRLWLEPSPVRDLAVRTELGRQLLFLGARVEPGRLVLLWTVRRRVTRPRTLAIALGQRFQRRLTLGPPHYPMPRWRPGEVVRQVVPLPDGLSGRLPLHLGSGPRRVTVGQLDLGPARQNWDGWLRSRVQRALDRRDLERAERLPGLVGRPEMLVEAVVEARMKRVVPLWDRGLLPEAVAQLAPLRGIRRNLSEVEDLLQQVAEDAYPRARAQLRRLRGPLAFELLQAGARAAPSDPWMARRLEEARRRLPAQNGLSEVLELEIAQRALVLAPSAGALARLMRAYIVEERHEEALAAAVAWSHLLSCPAADPATPAEDAARTCAQDPDLRRCRWLRALAQSKLGQLADALAGVDALVATPPAEPLPRLCPYDPLPRALALRDRLARDLRRTLAPLQLGAHFQGQDTPLGLDGRLIASCASWRPGEPLTVELLLEMKENREAYLALALGSRRRAMVLPPAGRRLRLITHRALLTPASYPVSIRQQDGPTVRLGTVDVGPEATFGFELHSFSGWRRRGRAFGDEPVVGRSFRGRDLFGYVGERYADSFQSGNDRPRGTLISPPFRLRRDFLMVLVAGGDLPRLGVALKVGGKTVQTVRGQRSEIMRPVFIPIRAHRDRWARVVIRDGASRLWGHIAVDEIRQLDGPAPGVMP